MESEEETVSVWSGSMPLGSVSTSLHVFKATTQCVGFTVHHHGWRGRRPGGEAGGEKTEKRELEHEKGIDTRKNCQKKNPRRMQSEPRPKDNEKVELEQDASEDFLRSMTHGGSGGGGGPGGGKGPAW